MLKKIITDLVLLNLITPSCKLLTPLTHQTVEANQLHLSFFEHNPNSPFQARRRLSVNY